VTDATVFLMAVGVTSLVAVGATLLVWVSLPGEKCRCRCPTAPTRHLRRKAVPVPPVPTVAPAAPKPVPHLSSNVVVVPVRGDRTNGGS
jgi:hypothetical protein